MDGGGDTWNEESSSNDVTFPSLSGSVPNVITFPSENSNHHQVELNPFEMHSNDFSSLDTSTMTESTLIAIEATRIASNFFNNEMTFSSSSATSLEIDNIGPPSHLNSLANSGIDFESLKLSPKSLLAKKNLPITSVARRALSNSIQASSMDSLEMNSFTNIDCVNPPSFMSEVLDLENSITSIDSLPHESVEVKLEQEMPVYINNQPISLLEIDNVNPPSFLHEITDLCNSLADVATDTICSQTEVFQDCFTHVAESDAHTEEDITEFSDANSITPLNSEPSSAENSPKKSNSKSHRHLTPKQKRNLARDRYKTYTVAAEMVMTEQNSPDVSESSNLETAECPTETFKTARGTERSLSTPSPKSNRSSPKQKRQNDRSRFQTQILSKSLINMLQQNKQANQSESTGQSVELDDIVQQEANLVLQTLNDTKLKVDDLIDCETLSLVSNDDDSEHNSGHSVNYRTYHKSWGFSRNIPVIQTSNSANSASYSSDNLPVPEAERSDDTLTKNESDTEQEQLPKVPKIVKPDTVEQTEENIQVSNDAENETAKAIRGRRKPLYAKTNINSSLKARPLKNVTSNLVKNVTTTIKSNITPAKIDTNRNNNRMSPKKGIPQITTMNKPTPRTLYKTNSPARPVSSPNNNKVTTSNTEFNTRPVLERQGTFPKSEPSAIPKSRIPTTNAAAKPPPSRIARAVTTIGTSVSRGAKPAINGTSINKLPRPVKSFSADRSAKSASLQQLKQSSSGDVKEFGATKGSGQSASTSKLPMATDASKTTATASSSKQITSKIASLWKKIEESKKAPPKKDNRKWIQAEPQPPPRLLRSKTFDSDDIANQSQT